MKIWLINGSPRQHGCTDRALQEIQTVLKDEGLEAEIFWIGNHNQGCIACGSCKNTGRCVFDDAVNEFARHLDDADGFIFGSPVYYGSASGGITCFLDRLFYSAGSKLRGKPGACIVSCRRGGASLAFQQLNMYLTINQMPVVSSQYWNQVHGNTPDEVEQDGEGLQTMRTLGHRMAWLVKAIAAGNEQGITCLLEDTKISTNFIR